MLLFVKLTEITNKNVLFTCSTQITLAPTSTRNLFEQTKTHTFLFRVSNAASACATRGSAAARSRSQLACFSDTSLAMTAHFSASTWAAAVKRKQKTRKGQCMVHFACSFAYFLMPTTGLCNPTPTSAIQPHSHLHLNRWVTDQTPSLTILLINLLLLDSDLSSESVCSLHLLLDLNSHDLGVLHQDIHLALHLSNHVLSGINEWEEQKSSL